MKYVFYIIGILLLTLGIAFTIQSNLGTSPFDAVLVGLARSVGLTVGIWEIIWAVLMIGINFIFFVINVNLFSYSLRYNRKRFHKNRILRGLDKAFVNKVKKRKKEKKCLKLN